MPTKPNETKLWKYNRVTGYWVYVRSCLIENAQQYLDIFESDEPNEIFKL